MDESLAAGTDLLFHKNRISGFWGPKTPYGIWLQGNEITTIFFGGVNADWCVWSTLVDGYFKGHTGSSPSQPTRATQSRLVDADGVRGYDTVYVDDISATISPDYAIQMTR